MKVLNRIFGWATSSRMKRLEYMMSSPADIQQEVFTYLIEKAVYTEWGKKYGYSSITSPEIFRERVPVSTYEDLFPFIDRIMKGEQNILWPEPINFFSKSSGTTNAKSKFIPVSEESLFDCHYQAGKDMLSLYSALYPETNLFKGKCLAIGGSYQKNFMNQDLVCGDVSAILMKNLPFWAQYMRTPSIEVALMEEWEAKIEKMAHSVIDEYVVSMAGVPTWTLVLLERILEITGKSSIAEVWPDLELFAHGAVAFGPYRDTFKKLINNPRMNYLEVYNASEGYFGLQDRNVEDEMLLLLDHGIYYEFIPSSEWGKDHPKAVGVGEVELGKNYAMLITTNAGLWRYQIGDTVRFTSLAPHRIKISGRTKQFINAFGEELIVENAEDAITKACKATEAQITNFTAGPIYLEQGKKGGHEWIIEFEKLPNDFDKFSKILDQRLQEINSDYEAKRYKDIALIRPKIHCAEQGLFYKWMAGRGKLGGQHKVPRLANSREYLDSILEMI
ncbi:GH3 auxin-responsive promoter family protein [Sediminitomix flava]|uniref:GH3 auxin-responsive promoter n=1 Tax=Sediminitomix flava TaxID=379075 RepID=A0A315Z4N0_SEDFL|nr:GH3 auxin-responsive promoter family protein [Sediminitomix flava]PWJ38433.1 GH3 auxin-responsive promoter [Sediminitomix flava]